MSKSRWTAKQIYAAIMPETRQRYERVFAKARKRGYVKTMSIKHKQAAITVAYHSIVRSNLKFEDALLRSCSIDKKVLYAALEKGHVWESGQWIPKWHIESVKDLLGESGIHAKKDP